MGGVQAPSTDYGAPAEEWGGIWISHSICPSPHPSFQATHKSKRHLVLAPSFFAA